MRRRPKQKHAGRILRGCMREQERWLAETCRLCGGTNREHCRPMGTLLGKPLMNYYPCFEFTQAVSVDDLQRIALAIDANPAAAKLVT